MLEFVNDVCFVWKPCNIRRPQTKGKVERLVSYVKDNFMAARTFTDINTQAKDWCNKVNAKASATTNETAVKGLTQENLKPLPDAAIPDRYRYENRIVAKDGVISYGGVRWYLLRSALEVQRSLRDSQSKERLSGNLLRANAHSTA